LSVWIRSSLQQNLERTGSERSNAKRLEFACWFLEDKGKFDADTIM
jgi:hypothetical protein